MSDWVTVNKKERTQKAKTVQQQQAPASQAPSTGSYWSTGKKNVNSSADYQRKYNSGSNKQKKPPTLQQIAATMDDDDDVDTFHIQTVSRESALKIQQARMAKGISQRDLALKISEKESIVRDYENAKAIPNTFVMQKLESALGIKLRK